MKFNGLVLQCELKGVLKYKRIYQVLHSYLWLLQIDTLLIQKLDLTSVDGKHEPQRFYLGEKYERKYESLLFVSSHGMVG